jgi:hypothetical protein
MTASKGDNWRMDLQRQLVEGRRILRLVNEHADAMIERGYAGPGTPAAITPVADGHSPARGRKAKQADLLIALARTAELFHAPDGVAYASIDVDGHRETHALRRKGFRTWLTREFYMGHSTAPGAQAMEDALGVLEAQACFDGPEIRTFLRVGEADGVIYLDLGDDCWRAVRITPDRWDLVSSVECRFRRAPGLRPLPVPLDGGDIHDLRGFVNVGEDCDFHLLVAAQLATFNPRGPYPIVNYQGEQGSAKTTTARVQRELIDPASVALRAIPRDERDLHIAATNGWFLIFDNVSKLPPWISDALCRLSTGGGFSTRQLYTDQDEVLFDVTRPVILTGIEDVVERDDLRDRAVILTLPTIPDRHRKTETTFWTNFQEARPHLLGALLNGVARAMRELDTVTLSDLPRMADFARWATAGASAFGWTPGTILDSYTTSRRAAVQQFLDGDRLATAIMEAINEIFTGTSGHLLKMLTNHVPEEDRGPDWPKTPRGMSGRLRRLAPALRREGYEVTFVRRTVTVRKNGWPANRMDRTNHTTGDLESRPDRRSDGSDGCLPASSGYESPEQAERRGLQVGA